MYKIFNWLESFTDINKANKFKNRMYNIFIPFFLLMEYICYVHFWKKIVVFELLTSDEIVEFLEKNEFSYVGNKIYKGDLLSNNQYFDRISLEDAKHVIKKEYIESFTNLLEENIPLNIEDYISLIVSTEIKFIEKEGQRFKEKIYYVTIQFCRYVFLREAIRKTINWIIIVAILSTALFLLSFYFLNHFIIK